MRHNPRWHSNTGAYWVARSAGLRTQININQHRDSSHKPTTEEALLGILLDGVIKQPDNRQRDGQITKADISTDVSIGNAFSIAIEISVSGSNNNAGSFEWGPYQGNRLQTSVSAW